jgi:endonuclease/exonuclease/phosphatase family metal-dependent hydrolase
VKLRILTLNAGLLSFFCGRICFSPFVEERAAALPASLRLLNADVVALQEVYHQTHRDLILSQLHDLYPFAGFVRRRRFLGLENGSMVLSKVPLSAKLELFRHAPLDETFLDSKGSLLCELDFGESGTLAVLNMHTTAGGMRLHPEARRADYIRSKQIAQFLTLANELNKPTIIVGDLNAGPGVSEENFRQVLKAGYESVYDVLCGNKEDVTWDPQNALNRKSPHSACPPQRIDHVLIRKIDFESGCLRPLNAEICCREEVVPVSNGAKVTISDHFGLWADIEWHPGVSRQEACRFRSNSLNDYEVTSKVKSGWHPRSLSLRIAITPIGQCEP